MLSGSLARRLSLGLVAACAGCATNSAPEGWLLKPTDAQSAAYGGWIELTYGMEAKRRADGELIAVSADSVWVLGQGQALVIPTAAVAKGKLTAYAAQKGSLTAWTIAGSLATISNGAFLIFTAPMWIIGGSLAVGSESRAPERSSPPLGWGELAPFARFPQGMPAGLDLTMLEARMVELPAKK
ncbi:MAG TPA: hypothetical protein VFU40_08245 [Gemmatimonadales bacterium]|nr:hypothetical protein [Gemmatimonadales bacterium]